MPPESRRNGSTGGPRPSNGSAAPARLQKIASLYEEPEIKAAASPGERENSGSEYDKIPFEPGRTVEVSRDEWLRLSSRAAAARGAGRRPSGRSIFGLPVLRPDSKIASTWSLIFSTVDLTYTSFFVSVSLAFDSIVGGTSWTWLTAVDVAATGLYLIDILMEFHTGLIAKYDVHCALVLRGADVARRYACRADLGGLWVDAQATLAIVPEILGSMIHGISGAGYKAFYLFRLLRLLRVARMLRGAWGLSLLASPLSRALFRRANTAALFLMSILFVLAVMLNTMACLWWFLAELEGLKNSWVAATSAAGTFSVDLLTTGSDPARYLASHYFAMMLITTVGFGDISPVTPGEQALATFFMLIALFNLGYTVNVIGVLLGEVSSRAAAATALRKKLEDVELWMAERRLPADLQSSARRYYTEQWYVPYFAELPAPLRGAIVRKVAGEAVRGSRMLGVLSSEIQAFLAEGAVPLRLLAGHDLCIEGESSAFFWVLKEGEVRFYRGMHVTGGVHAPAVIGESSVFAPWIEDCQERMHTVRGVASCSLWEFKAGPLQRVAKRHPSVLRVLCDSYLKYLEEVERRWTAVSAGKGRGRLGKLPKRVPRIRELVVAMSAAAVEKERAEGEKAAAEEEAEQRASMLALIARDSMVAVPEDEQLAAAAETGGGDDARA